MCLLTYFLSQVHRSPRQLSKGGGEGDARGSNSEAAIMGSGIVVRETNVVSRLYQPQVGRLLDCLTGCLVGWLVG